LASRQLKHQISNYADDVVIFLRPDPADIVFTLDILQLFGRASGLQTNVEKSSVLPIHCNDQILAAAMSISGFPMQISSPASLVGEIAEESDSRAG
jgi:hypothetical protein